MTDDRAVDETTPQGPVIDLSVEVIGTPEEVWTAIATGPGISSWFVPTTVDEHEGGATTSRFGEGPDMVVTGRVAAWDPPRRVVFDGPDGSGMAFEWLVEASGRGSCLVRLVNSGFAGDDWQDEYDGMAEGWLLFLHNLQLHLIHFGGQTASSALPTATWAVPRAAAWARLTEALGLPSSPAPGEHVAISPDGGGHGLSGAVVQSDTWRISVLLDAPTPGTAFLACEGTGGETSVSVWLYLYGDRAPELAADEAGRWTAWLESHAPTRP